MHEVYFFQIFFSLDQNSALQDHSKNNYLILNSKFKPHKLFKVSSFAFVHPVIDKITLWPEHKMFYIADL